MKPDAEVREDVIRQLQWDAQVPDPDAIGWRSRTERSH
jgi:hypothetical protein